MLIFDIETDGFYEDVTKVHCIVIKDTATGFVTQYNNVYGELPDVEFGARRLMDADCLCGHNILKYDIPVLQKLYPWFKPKGRVIDTLILGRLIYPDLTEIDDKLMKAGRLPPKHFGAHKLEAWGHRLGVLKGEFEGPWEEWSQTMEDYCVQDVVVTEALYNKFQKRRHEVPDAVLELEQNVARIISRQEINGIHFDVEAATQLYATLSKERLALEDELKKQFGFWFVRDGSKAEIVPKTNNAKLHRTKDAALTKVRAVYFNPGSRHHIARVLTKHFGWKPTALTPSGQAEVSEESLKAIVHPQAKTLLRYLMVEKRIGQLAEGKEALLKHVRNGKIHGDVNTMGAVTSRMAHARPNLAQVPAVRSEYGEEFRKLFKPRPTWVFVGADADALELRDFAHYVAAFDGGAYIKTVLEGDKKQGTDMHSVNCRALGMDPQAFPAGDKETGRDIAKTWFYAFLYGAGDEKLGKIQSKKNAPAKNKRMGKEARASFLTNLPALGELVKRVKSKAKAKGFLVGLDGRRLHCRSQHSALNTLLQAAGAIAMKAALVILDNNLQATLGLTPGDDYEFVLNIHDEWQIECRPEVANQVGEAAVQAIREAGARFGMRCPLDGQFTIGSNWAETH